MAHHDGRNTGPDAGSARYVRAGITRPDT